MKLQFDVQTLFVIVKRMKQDMQGRWSWRWAFAHPILTEIRLQSNAPESRKSQNYYNFSPNKAVECGAC